MASSPHRSERQTENVLDNDQPPLFPSHHGSLSPFASCFTRRSSLCSVDTPCFHAAFPDNIHPIDLASVCILKHALGGNEMHTSSDPYTTRFSPPPTGTGCSYAHRDPPHTLRTTSEKHRPSSHPHSMQVSYRSIREPHRIAEPSVAQ